MNVLPGSLVIATVTAVALAAMLFVRRRAPGGSYFEDGDSASGVFGVLAAGFSARNPYGPDGLSAFAVSERASTPFL